MIDLLIVAGTADPPLISRLIARLHPQSVTTAVNLVIMRGIVYKVKQRQRQIKALQAVITVIDTRKLLRKKFTTKASIDIVKVKERRFY